MNKTPIESAYIRKGDLIRWEHQDSDDAREWRADYDHQVWSGRGQHYLLDRPKPKVELPTEPGVYLPFTYKNGSTPNVWLHTTDGRWLRLPNATGYKVEEMPARERERHAETVTKLEPVPVTAKKVLDAIRSALIMPTDGKRPDGVFTIDSIDLAGIAAQFGVAD